MLDKMRTQSQSWIIWLMFGAIILVFAINFGPGFDQLSQTGCGRGASVAAIVNGADIPARLYEMQWRTFVQQQRIPTYLRKLYRGQILDQVINLYLMAQEGERYGIRISEDDIDKALLDDPSFQRNGVFDQGYFRSVVNQFRLTPAEYKEFIRLRLQATRMQALVSAGVAVSEKEAVADYKRKNTKVQIEYVAFDASKIKKTFQISAAEADAFVKKAPKRLQTYYDANLNKFTIDAKVKTRHIILTFAKRGKPTTAELLKLKDKIEEIRKEVIKKPKNFANFAKKYSQEPGAKKSGGALPYIKENQKGWDPIYVAASFKLKKKGEISPVVKSSFGYHIIQLTERHEAEKRALAKPSVKREIARVLVQQDKAAAFIENNVKSLIAQMKKSKDLKSAVAALKAAAAPAPRAPAVPKRAVPVAPRPAAPVAPRRAAPVAPRRAAPAPAPARRAAPAPARRAAAPAPRPRPMYHEDYAPAADRPAARRAAARAAVPAARRAAARRAAAPAARPAAARPVARVAARAAAPARRAAPAPRLDLAKAKAAAAKKTRGLLLQQQLKAKSTPPFPLDSESIPGIKAVGAPVYPLVKAAFLLSTKQPWSDKPIKVLEKIYVIRLKKRTEANMKKFEKQKDGYINTMATRRRREFQQAWLKQLKARAKLWRNAAALKPRQ